MATDLVIRDAILDDLTECGALDLSYETDYVWQIDVRDEAGAIVTSFRTARLPRLMRVVYPRAVGALEAAFSGDSVFLVAEQDDSIVGYLLMRLDTSHGSAWVTDISIGKSWRRKGIGTALVREAYRRARSYGLQQISVETQTKNYPGICFCQRNGFVFCGFNDRYYPNHDIALFFTQTIRSDPREGGR